MPDFTTDLFTRLINHRVTNDLARWEDYLTECFTWMLINDEAFREGVLGEDGLVFGGEHRQRAPADISSLEMETQVSLKRSDRVDLEITGPDDFRLLVENKVGSPFDRGQVRRYLRALGESSLASLVAFVPERGDPGLLSGLEHPGFLGIRHWEQVVELLEHLPPANDARDAMRASLLALMDQLGLKPIEEVFDAIDQDNAEGVQRAKTVCRVLDEAIKDAADDEVLSDKAPPLWCNDRGVWRLRSQGRPTIQGKGPPPRKVMSHGAVLESDYNLFYSVWIGMGFLSEGGRREARVGMRLQVYRAFEAWGLTPEEFVRGVLMKGGVLREADVEYITRERALELHERLVKRSLTMMNKVAARLVDDGVIAESDGRSVRDQSAVDIHLMPTERLLGSPLDTTVVRRRYADLLSCCLEAFFDANPLEPLAKFVAEAVMPAVGEM